MSKRKSNAFSQAIVGFFMVIVIALLGYFTIVISGVELVGGKKRRVIEIAFANAGGLKDHDNVMFRGTKVGIIERVRVTPSNLVVRADIDESVALRSGYRISVCNMSMLGGNYLQLEEGDGEPLALTGQLLYGEAPTDWLQDVSRISRNLKELTEKVDIAGIITNIEAASVAARRLVERIERGEGTVGRLLSSDEKVYDDMRSAVSNVNAVVMRVNRGEGTLGHILSEDESLYADLKAGVAAFRKATESFDSSQFNFGDIKGDVRRLTESGEKLLSNLNAVAERLKAGEGTMGRLVNDDRLYSEVEGLVRDVRQIIDNYRDTTPITTFSSLATGAL